MQPYGMQSMLKEGHKHLSGLDEAVLKNIDACKQLSAITRTSLGPNGTSHLFLDPLLFWVFAVCLQGFCF
jgi:T-complex protein 1 subunit theta